MMRFTVATTKLRDAVTRTCAVVPRRSAFQALEQVKVCAGDGVTLYATDLEVGVGIRLDAEVHEGGSVCVNAASLRSILCSTGAETLDVHTEDNTLVLESSRSLFRLPASNEFPELWQCSGQGSILARQLPDALRHLVRFVCKDESRPALTGVLFEFKGDLLTLVATDNYRLGRFSFSLSCSLDRQFILPLRAVKAFCAVFNCTDLVTFYSHGSGVLFRTDTTELFAVPLNCAYPDYHKVFPESFVATVEVDRRELISALREVSCIHGITGVAVFPETVLLRAHSDVGTVERRVEAKGDGEVETCVNVKYLLEGLEMFGDESVVLCFSGWRFSPLVIQRDYLLMPVVQQ
jgi:DNA polymerase-3 subunit beta